MSRIDLLSTTTRVEAPFIIVQIGKYTFGYYNKEKKNIVNANYSGKATLTTFPNFMESLYVQQINGAINQYTINMVYKVTEGQDPNMLEKVFSSVSTSRAIKISYGDFSTPAFIYKEQEAIITKITSSIDIPNYEIRYTINCTSKSLNLSAGTFQFPARRAKPSDVIKQVLYDERYGATQVLYGITNKNYFLTHNYIASDDKEVDIPAKSNITVFEYINYLVTCMTSVTDISDNVIRSTRYILTIFDETNNELNGPYLRIAKVDASSNINAYDTYEINIGYPDSNNVLSFNIENDETYSILYDFASDIKQTDYVYRINDNGQTEAVYSPLLTNSSTLYKTTEANKTWWTSVTQYPIKATLQLQGLLRPAMLMTYVKLNVYFFGNKHISSGLYVVTKQVDQVSRGGYRTTLSLTRIKGDTL